MKKLIKPICILAIVCIIFVAFCNLYMIGTTKGHILEDAKDFEADCILVLGCGVNGDTPSKMLSDRLDKALELYGNNAGFKLLMSGDHGRDDYNEVIVMKNYAIDRGVNEEDIFMDHAGFSTYESMYRARDIFETQKIIIVTQDYHLYRAVYNARALGIDAYGVCAEKVNYYGQTQRGLREILARTKDFIGCIFKPEPTYLGDAIPISGNGIATNG